MPHHADAPISPFAARAPPCLVAFSPFCRVDGSGSSQRFLHSHIDGVKLMVAGHFLGELAAAVLKYDKVTHQSEESVPVEHALQQHLQLGDLRIGQRLATDGAPG